MSKSYRSTFRYEGKRYERTSTKSQREADRKADKLLDDLKEGLIGISGKMQVKDWSYEWLETYKKPTVIEKSYKNYKRYVDNVINPHIGGLRLSEVKDIHLQKILNSRVGNSYSDMKHLLNTIQAIFKKAKESRLINTDPSEYLKMPAATKGTRRCITKHEREHFLKVAETHHSGLMFKTMLFCGLRSGEVTALSWKDIDFEEHAIKVAAAMESGKKTLKGPKTAAGVREVPIPDAIYYDLLARKGDPLAPVFVQVTTGNRHTENSRNNAWKSIIRHMDISMGAKLYNNQIQESLIAQDIRPYCLRHTFCTDLQAKGVPLKIASYLMGHKSISVTADIYTHITDELIYEAAKLIGVTYDISNEKASKVPHDGNQKLQ